MEKIKKPPALNKLAFVLYEAKSAPRYYEIKKSFFRFFLYGLPLVTLLSTVGMILMMVYFKQIRLMAKTKEPAIIAQLRDEKVALKEKQGELFKDLERLQNKLASGPPADQSLSALKLFKDSPGRQDLTKNPEVSLEAVEAIPLGEQVELDFRIVNLTKDQRKVSGFIFVSAQFGNQVNFWPANVFPQNEMHIPFNNGELFATSRFRPVKATFPLPKNSKEGLFKVLIFSRTGDLVFKQIINRKF